jgi:NADH/NAD ratio-sensing transcriptional regulator Rex
MSVRTNRAQVRQDFSKFQIGCNSGSAYETRVLEKQLRRALCVHKPIPAVMIGCGNWARALLANPALSARGTFVIKRVYSPIRINEVKTVSGHRVHSPTQLARYLEKEQIRAVVVASPAPEVKHLFGVLEFSPVVVLLNFSPYRPELTPGIKVFSFDLQVRLDLAAYHAANAEIPVVPENALL